MELNRNWPKFTTKEIFCNHCCKYGHTKDIFIKFMINQQIGNQGIIGLEVIKFQLITKNLKMTQV